LQLGHASNATTRDPLFVDPPTLVRCVIGRAGQPRLELNSSDRVLNALSVVGSRTEQMPLSKFKKPKRRQRLKRSVRYGYLKSAREAFARAAEARYGTLGPASSVRRIDPVTEQPVEQVAGADDIRRAIGSDWAMRL